jgi:hypothetical protein
VNYRGDQLSFPSPRGARESQRYDALVDQGDEVPA